MSKLEIFYEWAELMQNKTKMTCRYFLFLANLPVTSIDIFYFSFSLSPCYSNLITKFGEFFFKGSSLTILMLLALVVSTATLKKS